MTALAERRSVDSITFTGLRTPFALRLPVQLTDQELIAFSRSIRPYKVERNASGELEIMSPNGLRGASLEAYAMHVLGVWAEAHGGIVISSQGGFTLADSSVRMADASWISDSRWNALTDEEQEGFASISPDFLMEIRSKSDSRAALERKMEMWIANGAQLAWMIDPFAETVSVYRPDSAVEVLSHPEAVEAESVVAGFRLEMARLWAR